MDRKYVNVNAVLIKNWIERLLLDEIVTVFNYIIWNKYWKGFYSKGTRRSKIILSYSIVCFTNETYSNCEYNLCKY